MDQGANMPVDHIASNKSGGLTLKVYRGEDMALLAFDVDETLRTPDFVGFGVEYKVGSRRKLDADL